MLRWRTGLMGQGRQGVRAGLRVLAGLAVVVVALAGAACGQDGGGEPLRITEGRACQAVEFDTVEAALGVRFDTTAAARVEQTDTCVLTREDASLPDLMLAMSPTTADEVIFTATVTPSLASAVPELGRIAYQVARPPGSGADGAPTGPGLEIGWLSAAPRLLVLRYTSAAGTADAEVAALAERLIDLARGIEQASLTAPTLG